MKIEIFCLQIYQECIQYIIILLLYIEILYTCFNIVFHSFILIDYYYTVTPNNSFDLKHLH